MRKLSAGALLAFSLFAVACDGGDDSVEADAYVDGTTQMTENGAFEVTLFAEDGDLEAGGNTVILHVAFPEPEGDGAGIPNARVDLTAHMPEEAIEMRSTPLMTYTGGGEYRFDNVMLEDDGVWQFDFTIAVGEGIDEDVSFVFDLGADAQ